MSPKGSNPDKQSKLAPAEVLYGLFFMVILPLVVVSLRIGGTLSVRSAWVWGISLLMLGLIMLVGTADRPHVRSYWSHMKK